MLAVRLQIALECCYYMEVQTCAKHCQVPGTEAWETPLYQIPNHQEVQKQLEDKKVVNKMMCTPQYFDCFTQKSTGNRYIKKELFFFEDLKRCCMWCHTMNGSRWRKLTQVAYDVYGSFLLASTSWNSSSTMRSCFVSCWICSRRMVLLSPRCRSLFGAWCAEPHSWRWCKWWEDKKWFGRIEMTIPIARMMISISITTLNWGTRVKRNLMACMWWERGFAWQVSELKPTWCCFKGPKTAPATTSTKPAMRNPPNWSWLGPAFATLGGGFVWVPSRLVGRWCPVASCTSSRWARRIRPSSSRKMQVR